MEVFKSLITFSGHDEGVFQLSDTIWHESYWWLVATWLQHHATGHRIPERIVQMDGKTIRFQEVHDQPYRFLINNSIPISVFDGVSQNGYVISVYPAAVAQTQGPKSIH